MVRKRGRRGGQKKEMGRETERELARGHVIKIETQGQMTQDREGRSGDGFSSGK